MKLLKKILWLCATLATLVGISVTVAACDEEKNPTNSSVSASSSEEDTDNLAYVYRVSLQNETGFGFSGATVKLMKGDTVIAQKKTNASGNANFLAEDVAEVGEYTISISGAPEGYKLPDKSFSTVAAAGTDTVVPITPTGLLKEAAPNGHTYKLGDVMHDFSVTLANNTQFTLSEVLEEKQVVLINFWATWCGPCKSEFPAMDNALQLYEETVTSLAISTTDGMKAAQGFMDENGYKYLNVSTVPDNQTASKLHSMFRVSGIPHTVMVDRYGVIVFNEMGSMPSTSAFTMQFDKFIGEDYIPTVVGGTQEDDGNQGGGNEQIKPNVKAPSTADLKAAFATETANSFSFRFQEEEGLKEGDENYDEYNWPWLISEDKSYIYPSNGNIHSSYSILYSKATVAAGDVLVFDYKVGSEADCDLLYVMMDGKVLVNDKEEKSSEVIQKYSGNYADKWYTSYAYVFEAHEAGEREISFVFLKDADTTAHDDIVRLRNLRIEKKANLDAKEADINIFRHAATELNKTDKKTQFVNYVTPVYNEEDEYYHVNTKDGPVLYANMMNASSWNETSVWTLAYSNYIVGNGMNFRDAIEDFAWESTQITKVNGYTPVTKDLQYLLDAAVRYAEVGQRWSGEYHDKEWLELCVYWEHFGTIHDDSDPMAGITFTAAIPMQEGKNEVSVPFPLNPRGFKYKFIPTRSGVFKVYSTGDKNTEVFLMASDRKTMLGHWDDKVFVEVETDESGADISDANFEFHWYFNANETYYLLFTTYLDESAKYNVNVDYVGETYTYRTNAALGPYSVNLNTFELFLPDAIEYEYADPAKTYLYGDETVERVGDGYYHHKRADGNLGSIIYLDVNRPTAHFTSISLYDICRNAKKIDETTGEPVYAPEDRALYINDFDYTDTFLEICFNADRQTGADKGFAKVDKELFDLLKLLTIDKYDGIENSWLLLCYYDKALGAEDFK